MAIWTLRRKFAALGVLLVLLVLGWGVVVVAVAVSGAREQAATADAIAVLGAAQYNGRPSPVFKARLDHAATLYLRGQEQPPRHPRERWVPHVAAADSRHAQRPDDINVT